MRRQTSPKAELFARALRMVILGVFAVFVCAFIFTEAATEKTSAAVSSYLNFQARLETNAGAIAADGDYNVEFKIYNTSTSGGSSQGSCTGDAACLWVETRTSTNKVHVTNGYLTVNLGSVNAFPATMNWNQQLWITMNIGGTGGSPSWDGEMSPRLQLTATPYSFQSGALGNGSYSAVYDSSGNLVFQQASTIDALSATSGTQLTIQGGAATSGTNVGGTLLLQGGAGASTGASGSVIVKSNTNNSTTAFQVQNASGTSYLTLDTVNGTLTVRAGSDANPVVSIRNSSGTANIEIRASSSTTNTFIGLGSGAANTTGTGDTALGSGALQSNIDGYNNSAFGNGALAANSSGYKNSAFGYAALQNNTTGNWNSAFGHYSLQSNLTGNANAAFGHYTLIANQSGNYNAVFGVGSLQSSIDGNYNSALGADSLQQNVHGTANTAVGRYSLLNVNDSNNTAVGAYAFQNITTGSNNTALGYYAGYLDLNGNFGTISGLQNATAIGTYAQVQANNSIVLGSVDSATKVGIGITVPSNTFSVSPLDTQAGTVTATNASPTITGSGTGWTGGEVGDIMVFGDGTTYNVAAVNAGTQTITLSTNFTGSTGSGKSYRLHKPGFQVTSSGNAYVRNTSTSAFQVQNAAGSSVLNVDSSNTQLSFNAGQSGAVGVFATNANALPAGRYQTTAVSANGYMYVLGGADSTVAPSTAVYYAKINADGSIASWTTSSNSLPAARRSGTALTYNGYIYYVAGIGPSSTLTSTIYYARLNGDGSIGTWATATNSLPTGVGASAATIANGYMYSLGSSASPYNNVYYAKINADGSVGSWASGTNLSDNKMALQTVVANGYIYAIGGIDNSTSTSLATTYYAPLNANGSIGSWTATTSLPAARNGSAGGVANGYVYVAGGYNGTTQVNTVLYAKLNANGTLGSWATNTNNLPQNEDAPGAAIVNGNLYIIGGGIYSSAAYSTVYYGSLAKVSIAGDLDLIGATSGQMSGPSAAGGTIYSGSIHSNGNLSVSGNAKIWNGLSVSGAINAMGTATSEFQIQDASGNSLLNANTSNMRLGVNVTFVLMGAPGAPTLTLQSGGGLAASSTYRYEISAVDAAGGETTVGSESSVATDTVNLSIKVDWTAVTGAVGYKIYRTAANGATGTEVLLAITKSNTYTDQFGNGTETSPTSYSPPTSNTAYVSTNVSSQHMQVTIGGNGSPSGQLYVSGVVPSAPLSSKYTYPSTANSAFVAGSYLYTAGSDPLISSAIYDISDPAAPSNELGFMASAAMRAIYVAGHYAYVGNASSNTLEVHNVTNPSSPSATVGSVSTTGVPYSIVVQGSYAYVTTSENTLRIFNVSNPASPTQVGSLNVGTTDNAVLSAQGRYVYIVSPSTAKFTVIDVSTPASPTQVSQLTSISANSDSIYVQGRYAYVGSDGSLDVYDISNPSSVSMIGTISVPSAPNNIQSLYVQGKYVYVGFHSGALGAYDISNPRAPYLVGTTPTTVVDTKVVQVQGRYAYVLSLGTNPGSGYNSVLDIFDIGGTYTQQLEAGGFATGTLQVSSNSTIIGNANIQGALNVGQQANFGADIGSNGSVTAGGAVTAGGNVASGGNLSATGTLSALNGGFTVTSGALSLSSNNASWNSPQATFSQSGTGDIGIKLAGPSQSWSLGQDANNSNAFAISSSTSSASGTTAIFGNNTDTGNSNSSLNLMICSGYTAAQSGTATSITAVTTNVDATNRSFSMAIYSDSSNAPGALIANTSTGTLSGSPGANTLTISASFTAGTKYWLCANSNGSSNLWAYGTTTGSYNFVSQTFGTWPASYPGGTSGTRNHTFYVTYTAANQFAGAVFTLSQSGQAKLQNSSDSAQALQIQNATGANILSVDTSGHKVNIGVGATGETTPTLLVLDSQTGSASDPTEVDGAIYYNVTTMSFRCGRDGLWQNCGSNPIDRGFTLEDEFMSGGTTSGTVGSLGWAFTTISSADTYTYNPATPAVSNDHPGSLNIATPGTANRGSVLMLNGTTTNTGSMTLAAGQVMKAGAAVSSTTAATGQVLRIGMTAQSGALARPTTSGVWWEYDPSVSTTAWSYCYATGAAATCAQDTNVTAAVNTFVRLAIVIKSTGSGTSAVDFYINGFKDSVSAATVGTGSLVAPNIACTSLSTTSDNCIIDYYQLQGVASAAR